MKKTMLTTIIFVMASQSFAGPLMERLQERRQERLMNKINQENSQNMANGTIGNRNMMDISYGNTEKQKLDVYLPTVNSNKKAILMVHGGAWEIGDKRHSAVIKNKVKYFGSKGYTIISINYDLSPDVSVEQQLVEVAKALRFTQENASKWGFNPNNLVLMGHSAGAHLVSLLSTNQSVLNQYQLHPILGTVSLDSAAYDLYSVMSQHRHYGFYDKVFGTDPNYWKKMSPTYQINTKIKPMYLVCSTQRDSNIDNSCEQAEMFAQKASNYGNNFIIDREDKKHGQINDELGEDLIYTQKIEKFLNSLN